MERPCWSHDVFGRSCDHRTVAPDLLVMRPRHTNRVAIDVEPCWASAVAPSWTGFRTTAAVAGPDPVWSPTGLARTRPDLMSGRTSFRPDSACTLMRWSTIGSPWARSGSS